VHDISALLSAEEYSMCADIVTRIAAIDHLDIGSKNFEVAMGDPAQAFIDGLAGSEPDFARLILEW
jgi:hypothetical protein